MVIIAVENGSAEATSVSTILNAALGTITGDNTCITTTSTTTTVWPTTTTTSTLIP
jgi:arginine repressor